MKTAGGAGGSLPNEGLDSSPLARKPARKSDHLRGSRKGLYRFENARQARVASALCGIVPGRAPRLCALPTDRAEPGPDRVQGQLRTGLTVELLLPPICTVTTIVPPAAPAGAQDRVEPELLPVTEVAGSAVPSE